MKRYLVALSATAITAVCLFVSGCAADFTQSTAPGSTVSVGAISGSVFGGRMPIAGAHVYLMQAGVTGYAGPGRTAGSGNASVSLLSSIPGVTASDSVGNYVTTDANGRWNITGDYTACTPGRGVYIYSLGGKPDGTHTNPAAGLMASLGVCPTGGNLALSYPSVNVNEISTIAAAYAFAGFASDATHVSTGTSAPALVGLQNAFNNADLMFDVTSNPYLNQPLTARLNTRNGNGTVPQRLLNTLANIIAACVDSTSSSSAQCGDVFNPYSLTNSDTATAAIYMAHNPTITTPFNAIGVADAGTTPYTPSYNTAPATFAVEIAYNGGGLVPDATPFPHAIAVDGKGDVWTANFGNVSEFSPLGVPISGAGGYVQCGMSNTATPSSIAIDPATNNAWVGVLYTNQVCGLQEGTGASLNGSGYLAGNSNDTFDGSENGPYDLAFDGSGNLWVADSLDNSDLGAAVEFTGVSSTKSVFENNALNSPAGIAISSPASFGGSNTGYVWISNYNSDPSIFTGTGGAKGTNSFIGLDNGGYGIAIDAGSNVWVAATPGITKISPTGNSSVGYQASLFNPYANTLAIDGGNNIWAPLVGSGSSGSMVELNNAGAVISPANGYVPADIHSNGFTQPGAVAIDQSGNVWYTMSYDASVRQLIGITVPTATPLGYAVENNLLGQRP